MKECTKCREVKSLDKFSPNKYRKDGKQSMCKSCSSVYQKRRGRTKDGMISYIYTDQKTRSKLRGHPIPNYTKLELRKWLLGQKLFHELFDQWVESGYDRWGKPSCDRIDSTGYYELDNLQLMTSKENNEKGNIEQRKGLLNTSKPHKPVFQYTKQGEFVAEYFSQSEASRVTGINRSSISNCCLGQRPSAGGFIWKTKK